MSPQSSDLQHEEPPQSAKPLTSCKKTGEPYTRHTGVEAEICEALGLPPADWVDRRWRLETLAHLIRLRLRDNDPAILGRLTFEFLARAKPVVDRWSRGYGVADSEEIQIEVANRLGDLLQQDPLTTESEYLEVDAATKIKQITLAVTGSHRPKASAFRSAADRDEDGNYTPTVEGVASTDLDPAEHLLAKADAEAGGPLRYLHAIADPRHREAFVLKVLYDWPVKDGPPGAPTLCQRFRVSDRQIRYWIETAIKQMRDAHGAES